MDKELVMYGRSYGCPYISIAKHVLDSESIPYREIHIDRDEEALRRVVDWTGFQSVPTIVVADPGEDLPFESPVPLRKGHSPRGIDRGPMITEANARQLTEWLKKHGLVKS